MLKYLKTHRIHTGILILENYLLENYIDHYLALFVQFYCFYVASTSYIELLEPCNLEDLHHIRVIPLRFGLEQTSKILMDQQG